MVTDKPVKYQTGRTPTGVRGLKLDLAEHTVHPGNVAPLRGCAG